MPKGWEGDTIKVNDPGPGGDDLQGTMACRIGFGKFALGQVHWNACYVWVSHSPSCSGLFQTKAESRDGKALVVFSRHLLSTVD